MHLEPTRALQGDTTYTMGFLSGSGWIVILNVLSGEKKWCSWGCKFVNLLVLDNPPN